MKANEAEMEEGKRKLEKKHESILTAATLIGPVKKELEKKHRRDMYDLHMRYEKQIDEF